MRSRSWFRWLLVGGLIAGAIYAANAGSKFYHNEDKRVGEIVKEWFDVKRVVDGDTIVVVIDGKEYQVRLIGVDTPETKHPSKPVQCFGKEAAEFTEHLVVDGQVRLETDPAIRQKDKYGRLLRYVYLTDNTHLNHEIIARGYGHEYTYRSRYKHQVLFKRAQDYARTNRLGLWADSACIHAEKFGRHIPVKCEKNTLDCADFAMQSQAQAVYELCIKHTGRDIHKLDGNRDGKVCTSLP